MIMSKNDLQICYSPMQFPLFNNKDAIIVVIDIFRATSAICTAFHYGVERMIPVATVEEAARYKQQGLLAAAERNGEMIPGFDFGNSPFGYMQDRVKGQTIAISTTNGTQAIDAARHSYRVVIGSFLNISILSEWLMSQQRDIIFLCAGWKNKFNLEDSLFAGAVAQRLLDSEKFSSHCDSTFASRCLFEQGRTDLYAFLQNSSHRHRLHKLDLDKDVRYCLLPDKAPVIPVLSGEYLVRLT
jgi:2-phosphosulfolactate phosphatase